jgi:tetratricopeptide (TPR) repeat protein
VQAYKASRFEAAIEHFKNAVALDPKLVTARLYLATAYRGQFIPNVDSEENNRMGNAAIEQFKTVLDLHPKRELTINSLKGIASIYFDMRKFEEAKEYHRKVLELDPNDPEAYYSIGVIDWSQSYQPRMEARGGLGLKPDEPLKDKKVCAKIREQNQEKVKEGMDSLQKALQLRSDYDDAMVYLNLLYRERADIQCDDPDARSADIKTADEWVDKAMATKKARAEREAKPGAMGSSEGK